MGPGAFKHRGALHLRFSEGFLVHTSSVLGFCERVAFALQSRRYVQIVDDAMRLAAAYDLGRAATLRRARSPIWSGGVMLLSKSGPTDLRPPLLRATAIVWSLVSMPAK